MTPQAAGLYDHAYLDKAPAALKEAEKAAKGDQAALRRVAEVTSVFQYGYWMIEAFDQYARVEAKADAAALETARVAGQKALSLCKVKEASELVQQWGAGTLAQLGAPNSGFGKAEIKGGRRCWNSDETGLGDNAAGWAAFKVMAADVHQPLVVEMDVWGESSLTSLSIETQPNKWTSIRPLQPLSRKPQWDTL